MARVLTAADYRSGEALARAMFDMSLTARLLMDQRAILGDDLQNTEPRLPLVMDARVGTSFVKGYRGRKHTKLRREMTFGGQAVFDAQSSGAALVPIIRDVFARLRAQAPVLTGAYRAGFRYLVNGGGASSGIVVPTGGFSYNTILGVTNIVDYASTMERFRWHRPFRKVYAAIARIYGGKVDTRFRYAKGRDIGGKMWGYPVIEIAALNAMRGRTGIQIIRQRTSKEAWRSALRAPKRK